MEVLTQCQISVVRGWDRTLRRQTIVLLERKQNDGNEQIHGILPATSNHSKKILHSSRSVLQYRIEMLLNKITQLKSDLKFVLSFLQPMHFSRNFREFFILESAFRGIHFPDNETVLS